MMARLRRPLALASAVAALTALLVAASPLAAQRTRDEARLVITVAPGYVFGRDHWAIAKQPVFAGGGLIDTFAIARRIRPTLSVAFSGTYFPSQSVGLTAEALLLGLGYEDSCTLYFASGNVRNRLACDALDGSEKSASAVVVSVGGIFRTASRKTISPYARAAAGLVFSNQSPVRTEAVFDDPAIPPESNPVVIPIYVDEKSSRVNGALLLGLGFTAALAPGYQLRWELRDNIVAVDKVAAATEIDGVVPPTELAYRHLFSVQIGFDIVLERRRGRRY